jgi:multidrug transporter EmrE-like cation transporter
MTYIILGFAIIFTVAAQLLIKNGLVSLGGVQMNAQQLFRLVGYIFKNAYLLTGVVSFGVAFVLWLVVLSRMQLSIAYAISTSLNLCLVALLSVFIFGDRLTTPQVIGTVLIIGGIFLLVWRA